MLKIKTKISVKNLSFIIILPLFIYSCNNNRLINRTADLKQCQWHYTDKLVFAAEINNIKSNYVTKVYVRHTNNYKYSNLHVRVTCISPSNIKHTYNCEYKLASKEGLWIGKSANNLYALSTTIPQLSTFREKGSWKFVIEQNMRDDILTGICSAGVIIETTE